MTQFAGIALNVVLFISALEVARSCFRQSRGIPLLLTAATLAWSWCTLGMQILGSCAILNLWGATLWVTLAVAIAIVARWTFKRPEGPSSPLDPGSTARLEWSAILAATFLTWACLEMACISLFYPVKVMSDGPIYHLYFAIRWWKAGKLFLVAAPFGESAATYFPANGDLWFTWLMIHWGGDRLAKVGQAPFLFLSGLTAYQLARTLDAGRSSSLIAVTWFLSLTALLIFSFEANVDTIFIAGYLLAVYFFLRFAREADGEAALWLGGLAAGGAIGTKSVGLVFVPPLILVLLIAIVLRPTQSKTKAKHAAILLLSPLVLSGFWFLRNALLTGNPLYPLHLEILGRTLLRGWYGPGAMEQSQYYIPLTYWPALGDILVAVLDPRLVPFWVGSLLGLWAIPRPLGRVNARWIWGFALLAVANILLYWIFIPYRTQQRFMLQALALAAVPLSQLFERGRWIRVVGAILVVLHIVTPQAWPIVTRETDPIPWDLTPIIPNGIGPPLPLLQRFAAAARTADPLYAALNLMTQVSIGLLSVLLIWSWTRQIPFNRAKRYGLRLVSVCLLGAAGYFAYAPGPANPAQRFYPAFRDFYVGWMNLDAASGPQGSRIAYAGTNIPYYLFGAGLRNNVSYVNISGDADWQMHDYHLQASSKEPVVWPNSRPGWDRIRPDYESWLRNLNAARIDLLVVTKVNPAEGAHNVADPEGFPIERRWADTHPDRFRVIYGAAERDPWFRIYRLVGQGRTQGDSKRQSPF